MKTESVKTKHYFTAVIQDSPYVLGCHFGWMKRNDLFHNTHTPV